MENKKARTCRGICNCLFSCLNRYNRLPNCTGIEKNTTTHNKKETHLKLANAITLLSLLWLSACSAHFPVVAKIGGDIYVGEAIGRLGENGTFTLSDSHGAECHGQFDNSAIDLTSPATIECSDGRTGTLTIVRNPGRKSGIGHGRLNDGTVVRFAYGPTGVHLLME